MGTATYLIALGGNVYGPWGTPRALLAQLVTPAKAGAYPIPPQETPERDIGWAPAFAGVTVEAASQIIETAPLGPSSRRYANAVALIASALDPPALLALLKRIERAYGRRRGRRHGARPLDLDIIAWSGGRWRSRALSIPHAAFRDRRFVLAPLVEVAPDWRDPVTHLTVRQLLARLDRRHTRP